VDFQQGGHSPKEAKDEESRYAGHICNEAIEVPPIHNQGDDKPD